MGVRALRAFARGSAILYGVKPVVIAVILQALWGLGRTAVKSRALAITGIVCLALSVAHLNALLILFGAGMFVALRSFVDAESRR